LKNYNCASTQLLSNSNGEVSKSLITADFEEIATTTNGLKQNSPNPFTEETTIPFVLAKGFQSEFIIITNIQGRLIKKVPLEEEHYVKYETILYKEAIKNLYIYK